MNEDDLIFDAIDMIIEDEAEKGTLTNAKIESQEESSESVDIYGLNALKKHLKAQEDKKHESKSKKLSVAEFKSLVDETREDHKMKESSNRNTSFFIDSDNSNKTFTKSEFLLQGVQKIWDTDAEYQKELLKIVLRDIRKVDPLILEKYCEYIYSMHAFVDINPDYMKQIFGESIQSQEYGIFDPATGEDKFANRIMLPLNFVDGTLQGFVGYTPVESPMGDSIKYLYPKKEALEKSRLLFCTREVFEKSLKDGYICLTDGLFDAISLNVLGINAASFCGSAITVYHKILLSKIKTKIIVPDNDAAGTKLLNSAKYCFNGVRAITQTKTKDIDDFLKTAGYREKLLSEFEAAKKLGFYKNINLEV